MLLALIPIKKIRPLQNMASKRSQSIGLHQRTSTPSHQEKDKAHRRRSLFPSATIARVKDIPRMNLEDYIQRSAKRRMRQNKEREIHVNVTKGISLTTVVHHGCIQHIKLFSIKI